MIALTEQLPQRHLRPGELVITHEPTLIVTLLGSCVAVTMFSALHGLAAICHAMLPRPGRRLHAGNVPADRFKYLSEAVPYMAAQFRRHGVCPATVEVKMFGGAHVTLHPHPGPIDPRHIGNTNVVTARELLAAEGMQVAAANVGGVRGHKLIFDTTNGRVRHKHLGPIEGREAS
nr:chemotaxis protein CheD [uncultured bacterium]